MAMDGLKQSWATSLTDASTTAKEPLGCLRQKNGKWYKYVQYSDAAVAGTALRMTAYLSWDNNTVTCDYSDADATGRIPAGQLQATLAHLSYGWIQVTGMSQSFQTDITAGSAVGDRLTLVGAADGTLDQANTAADEPTCGICVDMTGSATKALLTCPF